MNCCSAVYALALEHDLDIELALGSDEATSFSSLSKLYFETHTEGMFEAEDKYTPHKKISILRRHFVEKVPVPKLQADYGITQQMIRSWAGKYFRHMTSTDVHGSTGKAHTDKGRLQQAVYNLLYNTITVSERGQIVIRVSMIATSGGKEFLVISVSDTGPGIPGDDLDTIFETSPKVDGSVFLGLSLTKHLVELLGGSVLVESEVGKGSTFTLSVPMVYQADNQR